jgi:transposase
MMAQARLSMRKIRDVLRLKFVAGLSDRAIARSIDVGRSTVQECLKRARASGLSWPLPDGVDDAQLQAQLYPRTVSVVDIPLPDFAWVHRELSHKGVTRDLLWREYRTQHINGLGYTAFCGQYRRWLKSADPVMRFEHRAGDKLFVDYAGHTIDLIDRSTGELRSAQIFVAVLGCSNYTFAEATLSQTLPDWLGSHVRAFNFFGGAPAVVVPDNLKSGVTRAHRYDPDINPAYAELAAHYNIAVLPARARKPRDKAKVEGGVLIVERWILACLRHRQFFSLAELNEAIAALLLRLNSRRFKKLEGTRHSRFIELEAKALQPLPQRAYEYATWKKAKVHPDYHVQVEHGYYSVPYTMIRQQVDVRLSEHMIEILKDNVLITRHPRITKRNERKTIDAHRPDKHRAMIDNTVERILARAEVVGVATLAVLTEQFNRKKHPEVALRAAQGILRLKDDFTAAQLEAACAVALTYRLTSYRAIRGFITTPPKDPEPQQLPLMHDNVRGPSQLH